MAALPLATSSALSYTVVKGDTLYSISRKYNVTIDAVRKANDMPKGDLIVVGQKLTIPDLSESRKETAPVQTVSVSEKTRLYDSYTVQKGDTFYHIAKVNDMTVAQLKSMNDIEDETKLYVGQQLRIPFSIVDTAHANLPDLPTNDPRTYTSKKADPSVIWPVKSPDVTYTKGKVSGVQLSAKKGEPVTCVRAGTVMYTGNYRGYGQVVFVQSKANYIYAYTGLESVSVRKGDYVVFGDSLGTAGMDSIKGTSQIAFMVFYKSDAVDPAKAPRG